MRLGIGSHTYGWELTKDHPHLTAEDLLAPHASALFKLTREP